MTEVQRGGYNRKSAKEFQIPIPAMYDSENGLMDTNDWEEKMRQHWEEVRSVIDNQVGALGDFKPQVYGRKEPQISVGQDTLTNPDLGLPENFKPRVFSFKDYFLADRNS